MNKAITHIGQMQIQIHGGSRSFDHRLQLRRCRHLHALGQNGIPLQQTQGTAPWCKMRMGELRFDKIQGSGHLRAIVEGQR